MRELGPSVSLHRCGGGVCPQYLQLVDEHRDGVELIILILALHYHYGGCCVLRGMRVRRVSRGEGGRSQISTEGLISGGAVSTTHEVKIKADHTGSTPASTRW